jgi:hypothetical protein
MILNTIVKHDSLGRVYPIYTPVVGIPVVDHQGTTLPLGTQPADGSYIQLDTPYPEAYRRLTVSYTYSPLVSVLSEDSEVYTTNVLRVIAARFNEKGKSYEGSVEDVTRVYNVTKTETYTVVSATKEYITLTAMGTWASGDVLEVDYTYVKPFDFMLTGVTGRIRYEQPYVLDDADAVLVTPYWAKPGPEDLFTALSQEHIGTVIIQPTLTAGNDVVTSHNDLSSLLRVITKDGTDYSTGPGNDAEVFGRNEIKWNVTKPAVAYTVQFTYHPTFTALTNLHTLRNSENKAFVNRVSVKLFEKMHAKVVF